MNLRNLVAVAMPILGLACSSAAAPSPTAAGTSTGDQSDTLPDAASTDGAGSDGILTGTSSDAGTTDPLDSGSTAASVPPTTSGAALEAWIATGEYKGWSCEAEAHAARPGSGHSRNRICSNPILSAALGAGEYPVGAAGVKELLNGNGAITGYAVYVKKQTGGGSGWFWYERIGASVVANGLGVSLCVGCHSGAPRDHVFTQVGAGR